MQTQILSVFIGTVKTHVDFYLNEISVIQVLQKLRGWRAGPHVWATNNMLVFVLCGVFVYHLDKHNKQDF